MLAKVINDGKYRNVLGTTKKEIMEMVKKMVKFICRFICSLSEESQESMRMMFSHYFMILILI
jgi:hypothetical protein